MVSFFIETDHAMTFISIITGGKKIAIPRHREMKNKFLKMILSEIPSSDYQEKQ